MKLSNSENCLSKRPKNFDELLDNDPHGLLRDVGVKRLSMLDSDKTHVFFEKAAAFVREHQRLPDVNSVDFDEKLLAEELIIRIRDYPEGNILLSSFLPGNVDNNVSDEHRYTNNHQTETDTIHDKIASMETRIYKSIDDVLSGGDPFGLLSEAGDKPIEKEHWNKNRDKEVSASVDGIVTKATKCQDFYKYQRYFDEIDLLLKQGHLEAKDIVGDSAYIGMGNIFVIDGMMSLIAEADEDAAQYDLSKSKLRYRVKQIFANGTESRPLSTSK